MITGGVRDCLAKLRDKNVLTEVPIYDYVTHSRRTDTAQRLFGHDVVLFEGILAFHTEVHKISELFLS